MIIVISLYYLSGVLVFLCLRPPWPRYLTIYSQYYPLTLPLFPLPLVSYLPSPAFLKKRPSECDLIKDEHHNQQLKGNVVLEKRCRKSNESEKAKNVNKNRGISLERGKTHLSVLGLFIVVVFFFQVWLVSRGQKYSRLMAEEIRVKRTHCSSWISLNT